MSHAPPLEPPPTSAAALDQALQAELGERKRHAARQGALLAALLYAAFAVLDVLAIPSALPQVLALRFLVVIPVLLAIAWSTTRPFFLRFYLPLMVTAYLSMGLGIEAMVALAGPNDLAHLEYYSGLILVVFALYTWTMLSVRATAAISVVLCATYAAIAVAVRGPDERLENFMLASNLFFLVSANVIGLFAVPIRDRNLRQLFAARQAMQLEAEQKAALLADLQASRDHFRHVANMVPALLFDFERPGDPARPFRFISARARDILEVAPEALMADPKLFWRQVNPADLQRIRPLVDQAYRQGKPFSCELAITTPSGVAKWLRVEVQRDPADQGKSEVWTGFLLDVSQEKRAAEQQVRRILEASPEAMLLSDGAGQILFANAETLRLFGAGPEGLAGLSVESLVPEAQRADHALHRVAYQQAAHARPLAERGALQGRRLDGEVFPVEITLSPFELNGQPVVLAAISDISARTAAERQMRELNEGLESRVAERTRELEEAKAQAEAASVAKGMFVANMSHEIRTPMNAVLGMTHLALRNETDDRQRDYLVKIQLAGEHLLGIISDVLDFSKIEAGRLAIDHVPFDLGEVLASLRQMVGAKASDKGLLFAVEVEPDVPTQLCGDPLRLGQILINLTNNAIKFTEYGCVTVRVSAAPQGDKLLLRCDVSDTGIGIAAEGLETLFQPFQQADGTITRNFGGTGLGLTISRQLAEMMGGAVGVSSVPGKGSNFWFTALVERDASLAAQPPSVPQPGRAAAAVQLQGRRVLVAEDNAFNQQVALELLSDVGIAAVLAENGQEAVALLQRQRFDAVLMDVQMPVMDGLAATRALRALPGGERVRVIAMTANASRDDAQACRDAGMDDFLAKPIRPEQLYAVLVRWIGQPDVRGTGPIVAPTSRPTPLPSPRAIAVPPTPTAPVRVAAVSPAEAGAAADLAVPVAALAPPAEAPPSVAPLQAGSQRAVRAAPAIPAAVDLAVLAKLGADRPERLVKLGRTFVSSAEVAQVQLERALASVDLAEAGAICHRLKPGARWMGALALGDHCEEMEAYCRAGEFASACDVGDRILSAIPLICATIRDEVAKVEALGAAQRP